MTDFAVLITCHSHQIGDWCVVLETLGSSQGTTIVIIDITNMRTVLQHIEFLPVCSVHGPRAVAPEEHCIVILDFQQRQWGKLSKRASPDNVALLTHGLFLVARFVGPSGK